MSGWGSEWRSEWASERVGGWLSERVTFISVALEQVKLESSSSHSYIACHADTAKLLGAVPFGKWTFTYLSGMAST